MENYNCQIHNKEFEFFCINKHQCDQLFCSLCNYEHQNNKEVICLPLKEYLDEKKVYIKKFDEDELQNSSLKIESMKNQIIYLKESVRILFQQLENNFLTMQKDVHNQFQQLSYYIHKINSSNSFEDIRIEEWKKIQSMINEGSIERIYDLKQKFNNQYSQISKIIEEKITKIHSSLKKFVIQENVIQQTNAWQLIGPKIFGIYNGQYCYQNKKNKVVCASGGKYLFGKKNEIWTEPYESCGYNITISGQYFLGNRIGIWNIFSEGVNIGVNQYDSNAKKQGYWKEPLIYKNEYIKNCYWTGEYKDNIKIGYWKLIYQNQIISDGTYQNGYMDGEWAEIDYFAFDKNKLKHIIIWQGFYQNKKKIGNWKVYFLDFESKQKIKIGGGKFNQDGEKIDKWKEVNQQTFNLKMYIIYVGNYNIGQRTGIWKIYFKNECQTKYIGGGEYKAGLKCGAWIDIDENQYSSKYQIIHEGNYLNGIKVQKWIVFLRNQLEEKFFTESGEYDNKGVKNGFWIEIDRNQLNKSCQILYEGFYKNGQKIDNWNIFFRENENRYWTLIGGGTYNQKGNQQGKWKEIEKNIFQYRNRQIILEGEYDNGIKSENGIFILEKIQIRSLKLCKNSSHFSGEGEYSKLGQKNEDWFEIDDKFTNDFQIIQHGKYINGLKIHEWTIKLRQPNKVDFETIGGGFYNEQQVKIGRWKEMDDQEFNLKKQILWMGDYKNGFRYGQWEILCRNQENKEFKIIGGGQYNQNGQKEGQWKELFQENKNDNYIILEGEYKNNIKINNWKINLVSPITQNIEKIGGGYYNSEGIKIGEWEDLDLDEVKDQILVLKGKYEMGKKIGDWAINMFCSQKQKFQFSDGGQIKDGKKDGSWTEICTGYSQFYNNLNLIQFKGRYKDDIRNGQWIIKQNDKELKGEYNCIRNKIGMWEELVDANFNLRGNKVQVLFQGEYVDGVRINIWNIYYLIQADGQKQIIKQFSFNKQNDEKYNFINLNQLIILCNQFFQINANTQKMKKQFPNYNFQSENF